MPQEESKTTPSEIKEWLRKEAEAKAYLEDQTHHLALAALDYIKKLEGQTARAP